MPQRAPRDLHHHKRSAWPSLVHFGVACAACTAPVAKQRKNANGSETAASFWLGVLRLFAEAVVLGISGNRTENLDDVDHHIRERQHAAA